MPEQKSVRQRIVELAVKWVKVNPNLPTEVWLGPSQRRQLEEDFNGLPNGCNLFLRLRPDLDGQITLNEPVGSLTIRYSENDGLRLGTSITE